MNHNLLDTEIDSAAKAYAFKNNVSYTEALSCVVTLAQSASYSESATPGMPLTDDQKLHAEALRYAAENRVSYTEALSCVVTLVQSASYSEAATPGMPLTDDQKLHAEALRYAAENRVSYWDALNGARLDGRLDGTASFSEAATSGAALLARQPIEIFRAGTHTDSSGNQRTFSLADVQAMATSYQPQRHEAPLTLGHPTDNKPAYGWVKALQATSDGRLLMMADQIDAAFADGVQAGRYKKRSASFYPPGNTGNPPPGNWYLKHVGWLGAQPPAIKGLADASFGMASRDGAISFEV
jgi:hypothetical protein